MEEEKKKRGRPASGINTVDIHYKMSKDLFDALPKEIKRNTYINDAVREKMKKDGYIREVELLESVTVNDVEYVRQERNNLSSCAQCELKAECWDLWHNATPCYGGFYKKKL